MLPAAAETCRQPHLSCRGMRCLPAHLYGAGVSVRVLNTRPTRPGGDQVPGTPKGRVAHGADVLLPCASLAPGLAEQPQESRKTCSCGVLRNASDTCPRWEQGSPPTEWCRLPYGVASQGTDIRYSTPQDELRFGASLTGATPRPRTDPPSEPDAISDMARSRRNRLFLDESCLARVALCLD